MNPDEGGRAPDKRRRRRNEQGAETMLNRKIGGFATTGKARTIGSRRQRWGAALLLAAVGTVGTEALGQPDAELGRINWTEAGNYRRADTGTLTTEQRELIAGSPVPVLLPRCSEPCSEPLGEPLIIVGRRWYSASLHGSDHSILIAGNRVRTTEEQAESRGLPVLGESPVEIQRGEGIVEIGLRAFGAAYMINIECSRPWVDERCAKDDYAERLTRNLAVAMPRKE